MQRSTRAATNHPHYYRDATQQRTKPYYKTLHTADSSWVAHGTPSGSTTSLPVSMPSLTTDDAANDERLKSALWYSVGKIVDEVTLSQSLNASPHFIGGLSELVAAKISAVATDLEAFAQHDGRATIGSKDVLLLARNNDALRAALQEKADTMRAKDKTAIR